ncbi:alpha/beta fold hydrolase [Amaricoccus tamworthensis]|uniref:alpha/beta fold hydrolase n=1 Tax=Amaricoccus tamworthensis TaxID=57002 RepID=UPI003C7E8AFF
MSEIPTLRQGEPSPVIFHLGAALVSYSQALLASPRASSANFPWRPELRGAAAGLSPAIDRIEVGLEVARRLHTMVEGMEKWQRHPYRRQLEDPECIWQAGSARLLDYGRITEATDPIGLPVLVVPSLINKHYILDLVPERSMLRWLAGQGVRPLLLDWAGPTQDEADFSMEDYGRERLIPALQHVCNMTGRDVSVLGYCMGGTLAAGLAANRPEGVANLVTIGAPWNFNSTVGIAGALRAMIRANGPEHVVRLLRGMGEAFGFIPVILFQTLFSMVNPMQASIKFRRFASLAPNGMEAKLFVALEDWLSDGVCMAAPAAEDLLVDWQIRNAPALGKWEFLGSRVDARNIRIPTISFCGRRDTIAPPPLAEALPQAIPGGAVMLPDTGHVGMVVGGNARNAVWKPLAEFLLTHNS